MLKIDSTPIGLHETGDIALNCIEICAGAGGQALGLSMAGFEHVALVEYESDYCSILKNNRQKFVA